MQDNVKLIVAVIMSVIGATGIQMTLPVRNDPFTGSQAALQHSQLERLFERKCAEIEKRIGLIEYRMTRAGINGVHK